MATAGFNRDQVKKLLSQLLKEGLRKVEGYIKEGERDPWSALVGLVNLSKDQTMPNRVRKAAADAVEPVGRKNVGEDVKGGRYNNLIRMSKDPDMPDSVRKFAANSVEDAAMQAVLVSAKEFNTELWNRWSLDNLSLVRLIDVSKDPEASERARKAAATSLDTAAMKAIKIYAKDVGMPTRVQAALRKVANELKAQAKRIPNPIAGDGVLSQGMIKPPAAKDAQPNRRKATI